MSSELTPYYQQGNVSVYHGDCLDVLQQLPEKSVHCCVTSPPDFRLRDYGVDGQIGLEPTLDEFVATMVEVFRGVRRVLRDDGCLWLNLGDSYNAYNHNRGKSPSISGSNGEKHPAADRGLTSTHLKPKDLLGIPWRVALALQSDGWYLRSDVVWHKPNPMPESVTDRPTKAHEYMFLLTKGQSRSRTVSFSDIQPELIHFGCDLGSQGSYSWSGAMCVRIATAIFNAAQVQSDFSLPPFYSKEWEKQSEGVTSDDICGLPSMHRMATEAARFLNANTTTKTFLCQMNRLWCDLGQHNPLLIGGGLAAMFNTPAVFVDRDAAITVHDTGQVGKFDFLHDRITVTVPTACKYFYDQEAVWEPHTDDSLARVQRGRSDSHKWADGGPDNQTLAADISQACHPNGRNLRDVWKLSCKDWMALYGQMEAFGDVWNIPTKGYPGAHFATFPPALIEPCIKAGTSTEGCCPECGAPWERVTEKDRIRTRPGLDSKSYDRTTGETVDDGEEKPWRDRAEIGNRDPGRHVTKTKTTGWQPTCECDAGDPIPCTILDPFLGSGTTAEVARENGCRCVGIELNEEYIDLVARRLKQRRLF